MKRPAKASRAAQRIGAADDDLARQGATALAQGQPEEAERIARVALLKNARAARPLHLLGVALLAQSRIEEAIGTLERAARASSDSAVETDLATAYRQAGRMADARACLERAITRTPPHANAFHDLGMLLFLDRELSQAETMLRRGLQIAPTMPELSVALGNIHLDRGDHETAKVLFARALANSPGHAGAILGLGMAHLCNGEFARAAERYRQVLSRHPDDVTALLDLGCCLLELGQRDEACQQLRTAVRLSPQSYQKALKTLVLSARGRFWFSPSAAASMLRPREAP